MPFSSRILVGLAAFLAMVALLGAWLNRQLMDTDEWTQTSVALLRDDAIRVPLANALAQQIADGSRAEQALEEALPPRLQPLAAQAGTLVADGAQRAAQRLLDGPRVQQLWEQANRLAHEQFVAFVKGDGAQLDAKGVVLDLRPIAAQVARAAGADSATVAAIRARAGEVVLIRRDRVDALRTAVKLLNTLSWLPAIASLLLYALALWLARGARRRALLVCGGSLVAVGLLALIARRVGGHELVRAVAGDGPYTTAASHVWRIATSLLYELATVVIAVGLIAACGAWLAGPGRAASWLRARLAPALGAPVAAVLSATALAYLALIAWGPLAVLRQPIPIAVFAALLLVGVLLLRNQVVRERAASGKEPLRPTG
jgi:hypothetical protein